MPTFWYVPEGAAPDARIAIHAPSLPAAWLRLRSQGEKIAELGVFDKPVFGGKGAVAEADLLTVYRQLALLMRGGEALVEALTALGADSPNPRLKVALNGVAAAVAEGAPFFEAMERFPQVFRPEVIMVVKAGEIGGNLPEALEGLATRGDTFSTVARKASLPLVYPILVCILALFLLSFFFTFLAPKFIMLFRELGMSEDNFPLPTLIMMHVSDLVTRHLWAAVPAVLALIVLYRVHRRTAAGRMDIEYWRLRIPLFGQLAFNCAAARMCATLGLLLERGAPTGLALRLAGDASGSEVLAAALRRAESVTTQGGTISEGLRESGVLPAPLLWRLSVAEASGDVAAMCRRIADFYVEATDFITRRTIAVVEPVAVIMLGLVVGGAVIGMFLPLISIIGELSQ